MDVRWEYLRPRQMEKIVSEKPLVYLPFGSLEWHGYHNPLGLDTIKARALCLNAAKRGGGIVTPATYWPIGGMPHPWTVRMTEDVVKPIMRSAFEQMAQVGFRVAIGLTGHYGVEQVIAIKSAACEVMSCSGLTIAALPEYELAIDLGYRGDHAAKWETSFAMHYFPDCVDMSEAEPKGQTLDGVHGDDPREHASAELGQRVAEVTEQRLVEVGERLLSHTPRERQAFMQACGRQKDVLVARKWEAFRTEAYWEGTRSLWEGDYAGADQLFCEACV